MDNTERRVGLGVGVLILVFCLYLIYRNAPFATDQIYTITRIILSLGIGIVAGTIPGFLNVKFDAAGLAVRAGGGMAAFVLTFFYAPGTTPALSPPPKGVVEIDRIRSADFRTLETPDKPNEVRRNAAIAITLPLSFKNARQPSLSRSVERTDVSIILDDKTYIFPWRDNVTMHEENFGKWLGKDGDAVPFSLASGQIIYREILHAPSNPTLNWGVFLDYIDRIRPEYIDINVKALTEGDVVQTACRGSFKERYPEIDKAKEASQRTVGRITVECRS